MAGTRPKSPTSKKRTTRKKTAAAKAGRTKASKAPAKKASAAGAARPRKAPAKKAAPTRARKPARSKPASAPRSRAKTPSMGLEIDIAPYQPKRGEPYMSDGQREHFHELLLAWKHELMQEVDRTVHHMQDEASNFPDPNDRASQESEFSLELRTRDRERKLLRKIEQGLKRLELNEYGWCESCGAEIGIRRLEARPTATLCIDCKTLDEIRERQTRG